ncbi:hypothetical protein ACSTKJ_00655 [Vibrio parahaemolyticus]|uniref:hypothetical protein n=1 Tax=Vibrio parahaemolyticus TaxID=670 RepID=UPI0004136B43|nr:hypothetical protein [Vibrio parahaemolyticus]HCG5490329.1 hypothetical protein [Vibrio parahaemolyticus]
MKVLFWNAGNSDVDEVLVSAANELDIDLFVLAEFPVDSSAFLDLINAENEKYELIPKIGCDRVTIYCKSCMYTFEHGPETSYYTSKKVVTDEGFEFHMVAVHLPSKTNQDESTQTLEAAEFKREIEAAESSFDIDKTFIVGDFNMNPFEKGMVSASAFHSIPCEIVASKEKRVIKKREHRFFYNPMWNLFGDLSGSPGTYFHRDSEQAVYFWNILDQVIMRPSLSPFFNKKACQ